MADAPEAPGGLPGDLDAWSKGVTAVLAVVTAIGGGAATLSGSADRLFREQPVLVLVAALAAGFAFAFIGLALAVGETRQKRRSWIGNAIVMFFLALAAGSVAVLNSSGTADQPGLTGFISTTEGRPKLELTVTASGVRSDERINVRVSGVTAANERDPRPLLTTVVGANRDGLVSGTFSVDLGGEVYVKVAVSAWAVKPRPFFCGPDYKSDQRCTLPPEPNCNLVASGESDRAACLLLTVPGSSRRPSLNLALTRVDDALTLVGTVAALPLRGRVVYLSIYPTGSLETLYAAKLIPELDGSINASVAISLDPALAGVCVVAVEGSPYQPLIPPCPVPDLPVSDVAISTTWLALSAPPQAPEESAIPSTDPEVIPSIDPEVTLEP